MKKRAPISDYVESYLKMEIVNRCPICGKFEKPDDPFTNHHINHDPSISEYWNLIRTCQSCHDDLTKFKEDKSREKRVYEIKRDIFRNFVGSGSYEVLLMAYKYQITSSLLALANSLCRFGYLTIYQENVCSFGSVKHWTFNDYIITKSGKEIVEKLKLNNLPQNIA
jgi:hypothetical protein